jgi:hypothetical protein
MRTHLSALNGFIFMLFLVGCGGKAPNSGNGSNSDTPGFLYDPNAPVSSPFTTAINWTGGQYAGTVSPAGSSETFDIDAAANSPYLLQIDIGSQQASISGIVIQSVNSSFSGFALPQVSSSTNEYSVYVWNGSAFTLGGMLPPGQVFSFQSPVTQFKVLFGQDYYIAGAGPFFLIQLTFSTDSPAITNQFNILETVVP